MKTEREILLVGQGPLLCRDFPAFSANQRQGWHTSVARSGEEAVTLAASRTFDAIVAEAQLPGTHGVEVLDELHRQRPSAVRIIMSDLSDPASTLQCVGRAHRHLVLPCDAATLTQALEQAFAGSPWVPGESVQGILPRLRRVPSPPRLYFEIVSEMQSPDASLERIGALISRDPALSAKLLQLANSAVFGLRMQVTQPSEAVSYIGMETCRSLILLAHTFDAFDQPDMSGFSMEALWQHSLTVGSFARAISELEGGGVEISDQAFTAGLLHDFGKLLLASNLPAAFVEALRVAEQARIPLWHAESQQFGMCHGQLGAALLSIWGLPPGIIEAVALHHFPGCRAELPFNALTAVHAADAIANALSDKSMPGAGVLDEGYLAALGLEDRPAIWLNYCKRLQQVDE